MRKYITDLRPGDKIEAMVFAVSEASKGTTKKNSPYLRLVLADKTGQIPGIQWDAKGDDIGSGMVVSVTGTVDTYQEKPQIKVTAIIPIESDDHIGDLVESLPPEVVDRAKKKINEIRDRHVKDETLSHILNQILDNDCYLERMGNSSASRNGHHHKKGELLTHSAEVAEIALGAGKLLKLDIGLLVAGAILHDVGKVHSYSMDGVVRQHTKEGGLLDHIPIGFHLILRAGDKVKEVLKDKYDKDQTMLLSHLVLSHHGKREWGSPVVPRIAEAEVLHLSDMISSRVEGFRLAEKNVSGNPIWSAWDRMLDRSIYLPAMS